jgi:flavin-dependent dehydrogenase
MILDYDILIVGAGPAGCAAAYDLAHTGKRVLLLDRRTFPRPKACACGLTRKTLKALRYSVEPVIERVCHEIVLQIGDTSGAPGLASETWVSTNLPAANKSREVRVRTRNPICAMALRERFDEFCLHQTLAAGRNGGSASLKKIDTILAIRELPTHIELDVSRSDGATTDGTETLTAPVLIGADGSNGQTRRLTQGLHQVLKEGTSPLQETTCALKGTGFSPSVEAAKKNGALAPEGVSAEPAWYTRGFALEATVPYTALPAQLPAGDAPHDLVFDFAPLPGGYGWLFPKGDHINIGVGAFADGSDATLKQVTRKLLHDYALQKLGTSDLPHITGQHLGMGGHAYTPRGRVLLTGDAAGLVDPLTGEGIHSAIVSGQAAAAAILKASAFLFVIPEGNLLLPPAMEDVASLYARELRPLQQTLAFSARAARAFYAEPERGFKAMRFPLMRSLILKTYADGLPYTKLLTAVAKLLT